MINSEDITVNSAILNDRRFLLQMKNKTKICSGVLALFTLLPGYAAAGSIGTDTGTDILDYIETQKKVERANAADTELIALKKELAAQPVPKQPLDPKKPAPVTFEGEDICYDQRSGAVYAKGDVKITQLQSRVLADKITGNTKSQDIYIDDKVHLLQVTNPRLILDGYKTAYNYGKKTGTMDKAVGKLDQEYIKGEKIEFYPDKVIIYNGTMTKCSAKTPDYHTSADKIEIWPNDRMVMHNAKFWLKNTVVGKKSVYETKIGQNKENTAFPRIGYNNHDGVSIKQTYDYPLADKVNGTVELNYYTKHDFKNVYEVSWNNADSHASLKYGSFEDGDNKWIKKEPTLTYQYGSKKIGTSPLNYYLGAEIGKWSDDAKTSWHKKYYVGLSHDTIDFSDSLHLYTNMEYSITKESYDDSNVSGLSYNATLLKEVNDRTAVFTGYHYSKNTEENSLFEYDSDDYARRLESGFSYRLDDINRIVIGHGYDLDRHVTRDVDYYWYHDMHCVQVVFRYRAKRDDFMFHVEIAPW